MNTEKYLNDNKILKEKWSEALQVKNHKNFYNQK